MSNTSLKDELESVDKSGTKKSCFSNQTLGSIIKRNIQKSFLNKNLKKRKNFSSDKLSLKEKNRRLFQVKHIYDSLEDSEDNFNLTEGTSFYISPESNFIYIFDFIILSCLAICIIYIPSKIAFHKNNCFRLNTFNIVLLDFIDVIFIIDLIINFYRGYYNNELKLISNSKIIVNNYLSTYFIYDLIAALPCCSFLIYYYNDICLIYSNNNQYLFILLISILKLFKCIKLKKNNKFIDSIYELFSKNFLAEQIFDFIKMFLITLSILHILVCCHIFIGYHFYPSWLFVLKGNNSVENNFSIYISSLYCLITTLTTVGYGDIVCVSFPERIFQLIELSLGVIFYSYIISKLGDYVKIESYATMIYNNNSSILEEIRIAHPKMPFKLYNQILHHLQSNFQQQKKSDINLLINSLPHALKFKILFVINQNYVNNFYFFKKCYNSNFIAYILLNFVPITYKKNTLIIKEDEFIDNAIFVVDGRLSLEIAIDLENPEYSIKKYLNKKYNPLKTEDNKNENSSIIQDISTIEMNENKKTDINSIKTLITKYTDIMKEKGIDFVKIERDFDESNYQFLNISNIFKNEHYGEIFIILNKPSPLFLRVKSKKANIFQLNRKHILHLYDEFGNIWKRLFPKSLKNMKALKHKTIEIVKKYGLTYNVKYLKNLKKISKKNKSIIQNKLTNENKRKPKIRNARVSLQSFLTKGLNDMKHTSYSSENINEKDSKEEQKEEKKEEKEEIYMKKEIIEVNNKNKEKNEENVKKNIQKNNAIINNDQSSDVKKGKTIDDRNNNYNRINNEKEKLFKHISTKYFQPSHYSINNLDKKFVKKLLIKLRKEIEKRNNYLKLFNESNKKIKDLYSQLVNNSIDLSKSIFKMDILDTEICNNLDISKVVLKNFNNNNIFNISNSQNNKKPINKFNSLNIKDRNKIDKNISSNSLDFSRKHKTNYKNGIKKHISKFNKKKKNNIEKIYINLNQPVLILNTSKTFDNRESKDKNDVFPSDKFLTLTNKINNIKDNNIFNKNYIKKNILNNNKENQSQIDILPLLSDNSHNTILDTKRKKNNFT